VGGGGTAASPSLLPPRLIPVVAGGMPVPSPAHTHGAAAATTGGGKWATITPAGRRKKLSGSTSADGPLHASSSSSSAAGVTDTAAFPMQGAAAGFPNDSHGSHGSHLALAPLGFTKTQFTKAQLERPPEVPALAGGDDGALDSRAVVAALHAVQHAEASEAFGGIGGGAASTRRAVLGTFVVLAALQTAGALYLFGIERVVRDLGRDYGDLPAVACGLRGMSWDLGWSMWLATELLRTALGVALYVMAIRLPAVDPRQPPLRSLRRQQRQRRGRGQGGGRWQAQEAVVGLPVLPQPSYLRLATAVAVLVCAVGSVYVSMAAWTGTYLWLYLTLTIIASVAAVSVMVAYSWPLQAIARDYAPQAVRILVLCCTCCLSALCVRAFPSLRASEPRVVGATTADGRAGDGKGGRGRGTGAGAGISPLVAAASTLAHAARGTFVGAQQLRLTRMLGTGGFGFVFKGRYRRTEVAIKVLRGAITISQLEDFVREAGLMASLRHPNVVMLMGVCPAPPALVTEFMPQGSLFDMLHTSSLVLSPQMRVRLLMDTARGMAFLHLSDPPVVHADLKSPNLLLTESFRVKVNDFGLSKLRVARRDADRDRETWALDADANSALESSVWGGTALEGGHATLLSLFDATTAMSGRTSPNTLDEQDSVGGSDGRRGSPAPAPGGSGLQVPLPPPGAWGGLRSAPAWVPRSGAGSDAAASQSQSQGQGQGQGQGQAAGVSTGETGISQGGTEGGSTTSSSGRWWRDRLRPERGAGGNMPTAAAVLHAPRPPRSLRRHSTASTASDVPSGRSGAGSALPQSRGVPSGFPPVLRARVGRLQGPRTRLPPVVQAVSAPWAAPEVFTVGRVSRASDVYSFGIVMFEVLFRHIPYREAAPEAVPLLVSRGKLPTEFVEGLDGRGRAVTELEDAAALRCLPQRLCQSLLALMGQCLSTKPRRRPTISDVLHELEWAASAEWGGDPQWPHGLPLPEEGEEEEEEEEEQLPAMEDGEVKAQLGSVGGALDEGAPGAARPATSPDSGADQSQVASESGTWRGTLQGRGLGSSTAPLSSLVDTPREGGSEYRACDSTLTPSQLAAEVPSGHFSPGLFGAGEKTGVHGASPAAGHAAHPLGRALRQGSSEPQPGQTQRGGASAGSCTPARQTALAPAPAAALASALESAPPPVAVNELRRNAAAIEATEGEVDVGSRAWGRPSRSVSASGSAAADSVGAIAAQAEQRRGATGLAPGLRTRLPATDESPAAAPVAERDGGAAMGVLGQSLDTAAEGLASQLARDDEEEEQEERQSRASTASGATPRFGSGAVSEEFAKFQEEMVATECECGRAQEAPASVGGSQSTGVAAASATPTPGAPPRVGSAGAVGAEAQPDAGAGAAQEERKASPKAASVHATGQAGTGAPSKSDGAPSQAGYFRINPEDLVVGLEIARGSYGVVFEGSLFGTAVAVKQLHCKGLPGKERRAFERECEMMFRCRHPNLVMFMGRVIDEDKLMLVTELLERGSLYHMYHRQPQITPDHAAVLRAVRVARDVARGVAYLHARDMVHRDLKSPNVLLSANGQGKVGDFGLSRVKDLTRTMTKCGSALWCAPEVLRGERFTESCDVYSFAIIVYELLAWAEPHEGMAAMDVMRRVAYRNLRPKLPSLCPISLRRVLRACWQEPHTARPPLTLVIQHLDLLENRIETLGSLEELRRVEAEDPAYKPELEAIEEERQRAAAKAQAQAQAQAQGQAQTQAPAQAQTQAPAQEQATAEGAQAPPPAPPPAPAAAAVESSATTTATSTDA